MKKLFVLLLALLICAGIACAEEATISESEEWEYSLLEDGTVEIVTYHGQAEKLTIPAELDGHRVTAIGEQVFSQRYSLTSVTIPDSVTSLGKYAFQSCSSLESVTIPDSVTFIGEDAFAYCGLTSVTIPDSVTSLASNPFSGCNKLYRIVVSSDHPTLTTIDGVLFEKTEMRLICYPSEFDAWEYAIPQGCSAINAGAFSGSRTLHRVTIPDSVTSIGDKAFANCLSLTNVTIPDSVTSIGKYAFFNCEDLTSVTIPDSVTSIGNSAFDDCSSLTSVIIPDSVTSIGEYVFKSCEALTSVVIPDSVTSIGKCAFGYCESLTSVIIPDSVTSIGDWAFVGCSSLTSITIPGRVTYIGDMMFHNCSSLTNMTIPDRVTYIGIQAFQGCTSLTSVTIPESVTSIGDLAFCDNPSLTSVTISDKVTSIGYDAFRSCNDLTLTVRSGSFALQYAIDNSINYTIYTDAPEATMAAEGPIEVTPTPIPTLPLLPSPTPDPRSKIEEVVVFPDYMVLGLGDISTLSVELPNGDPLPATDFSYRVKDIYVASVSENGTVRGRKMGRTQIVVHSSYNEKIAVTRDLLIVRPDYGPEDFYYMLADFTPKYKLLINAHKLFDGGYTAEDGHWVEEIDMSSVTEGLAGAYAKIFGTTSKEVFSRFVRSTYMAEQIMSNLSDEAMIARELEAIEYSPQIETPDDTLEILSSDLKKILDKIGYVETIYNSGMYPGLLAVDDQSYIPLKNVTVEVYNQWFDENIKFDKVSLLKEPADVANAFIDLLYKYVKYSKVDKEQLQLVIDGLMQSGNEDLQDIASILEMMKTDEGIINYLCATNGFHLVEEYALDELKALGWEALESIPAVGPFFTGAKVGASFGTGYNNLLMNVDEIQAAAYQVTYAINAAGAALPAFEEAFKEFMDNPIAHGRYEKLHAALKAYSELLALEYSGYAEFAEAYDEALLTRILDIWFDMKNDELIASAKHLSKTYRYLLLDSLEYFNETFKIESTPQP